MNFFGRSLLICKRFGNYENYVKNFICRVGGVVKVEVRPRSLFGLGYILS